MATGHMLSEAVVLTDVSEENVCISFWNAKNGVQLKYFKGGICGEKCVALCANEYIFCGQKEKQLIHVWEVGKVIFVYFELREFSLERQKLVLAG